jgi:hypothetical protein
VQQREAIKGGREAVAGKVDAVDVRGEGHEAVLRQLERRAKCPRS